MARKPAGTLTAISRANWDAAVERPFARIGVNHLLVCDPADELLADDVDATELAHRWNACPILLAALQLIARADSLHRARAAAERVLDAMQGVAKTRSTAVR